MRSVEEAFALIEQTIQPAEAVPQELSQTGGRIAAAAVKAQSDSPPFDKSMMDGFAVRCADVESGRPLKVMERVMAGEVPTKELSDGTTIQVMTGTQVPAGTEAVIPVEQVLTPEEDETGFRLERISAGKNVMQQGESMRTGETVLDMGERIAFPKIALMAELGEASLQIQPQPRIAVLATGNELVPIDRQPGPGQIRNSNEMMLRTQIVQAGGEAISLGIARDDHESLAEKIRKGLNADVLLLSGGVSAGKLDLVPQVLAENGVEEVFHKVHLKPGKPLWFGRKPAGEGQSRPCYVFGLPGNPVSSMVCFELFVRWALACFEGADRTTRAPERARLTQAHLVKGDRPVYYPARIAFEGQNRIATPVRWVGSADLRGASEANGMIHFPPQEAAYESGTEVDVWTWF